MKTSRPEKGRKRRVPICSSLDRVLSNNRGLGRRGTLTEDPKVTLKTNLCLKTTNPD